MKAKSKSTRTTKRTTAAPNINADAYQVALLRLYAGMDRLATAGHLLEACVEGDLPARVVDREGLHRLVAEVVDENAQNLYGNVEDLCDAVGVDYNHSRAQQLAEKAEGVSNG